MVFISAPGMKSCLHWNTFNVQGHLKAVDMATRSKIAAYVGHAEEHDRPGFPVLVNSRLESRIHAYPAAFLAVIPLDE